MAEIVERVDIRAPIDRVFAAITDPERAQDWNNNVLEVRDISPRPVQPGTEWTQTTMMAGRPVELRCRIARYERPYHGVLEVAGDHAGTITTICEEASGGTRVTQRLKFQPPGGLFRGLAGGFITNAVRRELKYTMDRQRMILEREYGATRGPGTS